MTLTASLSGEELPLEDVDRFCESFSLTCRKSDRVLSRERVKTENGNQPQSRPNNPIPSSTSTTTDVGQPVESGSPAATIRAQLVFVGWTPSRLSDAVPSELKDVVDYFKQLNRFMRVDLYDLGLWNPDEETIERLRFIADRRSVVIFQEAFLDAADNIGAGMASVGQEQPRSLGPPADYPAALARLHELSSSDRSSQSLGPDQRRLAWGDVQKFLNQQVIHPIREYALATHHPIERSSLMGIAELSRVFHTRVVLINEKLNWQISERGIEHVDPLPDDQLKDLLATADRIINMTKVTERCSQPRAAILQSKTIDSQTFPRLPHSG